MLAQGRPSLTTDLVGARQEIVQPAVLVDPLGGCLRPHSGHARQVIRRLPDNRRNLRVALWRHPVLRFDCRRRHSAQVARTRARVQHGDVIRHRLERIAVTRDNKDGRAFMARPVSQSR